MSETTTSEAESSHSKPGSEINERAPVVGRDEIEIAASPEAVWDVLTAIDRWPSWNPDVKSVSFHGDIKTGSRFRWKAGPGTITSTIQDVEAPRRIAWTGKTLGIKAIHVHDLEPRNGRTLVRTTESYDGLVARVFKRPLQRTLDAALQSGLQHLKVEIERRQQGQPKAPAH
jgi:carbon monoxide dehydrogenase subunit G